MSLVSPFSNFNAKYRKVDDTTKGCDESEFPSISIAADLLSISLLLSKNKLMFHLIWLATCTPTLLVCGGGDYTTKYSEEPAADRASHKEFPKLTAVFHIGPSDVTVITVVGQIGALMGGWMIGYISTFCGRRLTMMTGCICGGAMIPAYILPRNMSLVASAFFQQFFVGGTWG